MIKKIEFVGLNSLYHQEINHEPTEVRLRFVAQTENLKDAIRIGQETESLYTNGPYGGGGVSQSVQEVVSIASILIDNTFVKQKTIILGE